MIPTHGASPDPAEIAAWAKEHMANFKAPRVVEVVDALPLNARTAVTATADKRDFFIDTLPLNGRA